MMAKQKVLGDIPKVHLVGSLVETDEVTGRTRDMRYLRMAPFAYRAVGEVDAVAPVDLAPNVRAVESGGYRLEAYRGAPDAGPAKDMGNCFRIEIDVELVRVQLRPSSWCPTFLAIRRLHIRVRCDSRGEFERPKGFHAHLRVW